MTEQVNKSVWRAANHVVLATSYLKAAARVIGPDPGDPQDVMLDNPASFLIGHAIELALNAYLVAHRQKGGQAGHKLNDRLEAALRAGLKPSQQFINVVRAAHPGFANHQHRYSLGEQPEAYVVPRYALRFVRPEVQQIHDVVMDRLTRSFAPPAAD